MIIADYLRRTRYRPRGILHVGGHLAEEMNDYLALSPQRIMWIEGDPELAARLRNVVRESASAIPQLVVQALIADTDGVEVDFHRFTNDGGSSSLFRSTALLRTTFEGVEESGETLRLTTTRLATVLRANALAPGDMDVIVLDIQGAELMAMHGAAEYIASASFVETEVSTDEIYDGAPLVGDVEAYLTAAGFDRVTEIPWHGDVVFKRRGVALNAPETSVLEPA